MLRGMIGVDWGTSNFRAFLLEADGRVCDRHTAPSGVTHVPDRRFAEVLRAQIGAWLQQGDDRVLLCGAIGSREGWQEVAYIPCPVGAADLARAVVPVPFANARVRLVPGVCSTDAQGVPDTMRSEETQVVGAAAALSGRATICLPGTHSKWVQLRHGHIAQLTTHLTGEVFAALHEHTLLARTTRAGPVDWAAFEQGLARAADPGDLLHHLFGVRALGLFGRLGDVAAYSYLSGLLIGHELQAALPRGELVHLIGEPALTALYAHAIGRAGGSTRIEDADAAARGLWRIGCAVAWD